MMDGVRFEDAVWVIRSRWKWFLLAIIPALILTTLFALILTPQYSAKIIVAPREDSQQGKSISSDLISSVVGSSNSQGDDFDVLLAQITSVDVAAKLISDKPLLAEYLGRTESELQGSPTTTTASGIEKVDRILFGIPRTEPIAPTNVARMLEANVTKALNTESGLTTITFQSRDRDLAIRMLSFIVHSADQVMSNRDLEELEQKIKYTRTLLAEEPNQVVRDTYASKLGTHLVDLAEITSGLPYAYKLVEGPFADQTPHAPKVTFVFIALTVLLWGGLFVIFLMRWPPHGR